MSIKQRIESAITENKEKLHKLCIERDDLDKKKHFNVRLEYAYNKRCDEIRDLRCKINIYLEVLKWMEEEDK